MQYSLITTLLLTLLLNPSMSQRNMHMPKYIGSSEYQFLNNLTNHLHRVHKFSSFLIYRNLAISKTPSCLIPRLLEETLTRNFGQSIFIIGPDNNIKLRNFIGLNNLAFVDIASVNDPMLNTVNTTLGGLHFMPMIFLFKRPDYVVPNMKEIKKFFSWCWSVNIINVVLTFRVISYSLDKNCRPKVHYLQHQVFNYTPFPRLTVRNLTSQIYTTSVFLPEQITNVYGYKFPTPIFMDPPTAFLTPFKKHNQNSGEKDFAITGTAGCLFQEYIYSINGTIRLLPRKNASLYSYHKWALLLASKKSIDISIHPFAEFLEFAKQTEGSYPLSQTNACIIVPVVQDLKTSYLDRAAEPIVWLLGITTIVLILLHFFWYFKQENRYNSIGRSMLYGYAITYQQALPLSYFKSWGMRRKLLHVLVVLTFLVQQSTFTTHLTSLLSTNVMSKQIETEKDFLASGLQIMLHEYEQTIYFDTERLPRSLRSRLYVTDLKNLVAHRDALNTSFAYVATKEQWSLLRLQQRNLWKHKFRIASDYLCTANYFLKFPLQWDSVFAKSISLFSMRVQESGFSKKWNDLSIYQAFQMNLIKLLVDDQKHAKPLTITHFRGIFIYTMWLYFIAFLIFVTEVLYNKKQIKRRIIEELRNRKDVTRHRTIAE